MDANATLKFNSRRARRMTEAEALADLDRLGFTKDRVIRHTTHKDGRETLVTEFYRTGANADGSPRFDRARLTATFSI